VALPALLLPLMASGLTPGRLSDLAEGEVYLLAYFVGFFGTALYRFLRFTSPVTFE